MPIRPSPALDTSGPPRPSGTRPSRTRPSGACSMITTLRRAAVSYMVSGVDAFSFDVGQQDRGCADLLRRAGERVPVDHDEVREHARLDGAGPVQVVHVGRPG